MCARFCSNLKCLREWWTDYCSLEKTQLLLRLWDHDVPDVAQLRRSQIATTPFPRDKCRRIAAGFRIARPGAVDVGRLARLMGTLCHLVPEWLTRSKLLSFIGALSSNY